MISEIQKMIQETIKNSKLTDICTGKVIQVNPMKIDLGDNKSVTQFEDNLIFTEQVIEKRIALVHTHNVEGIGHTHSNDAGETTAALAGSHPTTEKTMSFVVNEGISIGDRLLMLRKSGGQQWIILSKLRDSSSLTIDQDGGWNWS